MKITKRKSWLRLALIPLVSGIAAWPTGAVACSCGDPPPVVQAFEEADAVFFGRAATVDSVDSMRSKTTFEVLRWWKGEHGAPSVFEVVSTWVGCGERFDAGYYYLIYASKAPMDVSAGPAFEVNACGRTKYLEPTLLFEFQRLDNLHDEVGAGATQ